jgi:small-conductance mechanosensitive channel
VALIFNFAYLAGTPEHGRAVALILLIAFFLLVIAAVPFEFNFYSALKGHNLFSSILAEVLVFAVMVALLAGAVLDWFNSSERIGMMLALVLMLLLLMIWFLHWRTRLISALLYKASKAAKVDLERLLEEMRKAEKPDSGSSGEDAGGKPDE